MADLLATGKGDESQLPFKPISLRNDAPVAELGADSDLLNFTPLAKEVAAIAVGTDGPFTLAVTAKWGYGKTSMLGLVRSLIQKFGAAKNEEWRMTHTTVWFNAWQYEREDEPIVPLLLAIQESVEENLKSHQTFLESKSPALWQAIKKLPDALAGVASGFKLKGKIGTALWLQVLTGMKGEVEVEFDPGKAYERVQDALVADSKPELPESVFMQALQELKAISRQLERAAENREPSDKPKIVVFVDDLDRCHPDAALRLLDGIKLVLNQSGFVFVLALDKTILEEFLVRRYREEYGASNPEEVGRRYVDKIIQLEIPLPPSTGRFAGSTKEQRNIPGFKGKGYLERIALEMLERQCAFDVADVVGVAVISPRVTLFGYSFD